jgi:hypothetical protein
MNWKLITITGFIVFMAAVIVGLIGGLIYMNAGGDVERMWETTTTNAGPAATTAPTTSTAPQTPATQPQATTTSDTLPATTTYTTTTTSTTEAPYRAPMTLSYSPAKLYKGDNAMITLKSGSTMVSDASIYVDGAFKGGTYGGVYNLERLEGGTHVVTAAKEGYMNATANVTVDENTYAKSKEVKEGLTAAERKAVISQGKANLRFYETSFCSNCAAMRPRIEEFVNENRDCIAYERLNAYKYASEVEPAIVLPYIVVEGPLGKRKTNGVVSMTVIEDMVAGVSRCDLG